MDVISEKPMADSPENCVAMLEIAGETGRTYVVSQNYRHSPAMFTLANQVRKGFETQRQRNIPAKIGFIYLTAAGCTCRDMARHVPANPVEMLQ